MTKAIPVSGGIWLKNCSMASRPPAEAPMPIMGNPADLFIGSESAGAFDNAGEGFVRRGSVKDSGLSETGGVLSDVHSIWPRRSKAPVSVEARPMSFPRLWSYPAFITPDSPKGDYMLILAHILIGLLSFIFAVRDPNCGIDSGRAAYLPGRLRGRGAFTHPGHAPPRLQARRPKTALRLVEWERIKGEGESTDAQATDGNLLRLIPRPCNPYLSVFGSTDVIGAVPIFCD